MNKYQRKKAREIKKIMRNAGYFPRTYREAKKIWKLLRLTQAFSPCEDCDNALCHKPKFAMVYCSERR